MPRGRRGRARGQRTASPLRRALKAFQDEDAKEQARKANKTRQQPKVPATRPGRPDTVATPAPPPSVKGELTFTEAQKKEKKSSLYPPLPDGIEPRRPTYPLSSMETAELQIYRSLRSVSQQPHGLQKTEPEKPRYWTYEDMKRKRAREQEQSGTSAVAALPETDFPLELRLELKKPPVSTKAKRVRTKLAPVGGAKEEPELEGEGDKEGSESEKGGGEESAGEQDKLEDEGDYGEGAVFDDDEGYDDAGSGADEAVM